MDHCRFFLIVLSLSLSMSLSLSLSFQQGEGGGYGEKRGAYQVVVVCCYNKI